MAANLRERYLRQGFLLVEGVFDSGKVAEALRALQDVPGWVRAHRHRNVQRAQPLQGCPAVRDPAWLGSFYENSRLKEILTEIFGGVIAPTPDMARDFKLTALLIEPLDQWWSTGLHRDYRDFIAGLDIDAWKARTGDLRLFNQINVPLLPDDCVWAVPGSHARDDTEMEAGMVAARLSYACTADENSRAAGPGRLREELLAALADCGAVNLRCSPGDLLLYRSNMLHCGVYEPGVRRMTVHDGVYSNEWRDYVWSLGGLRAGVGQ